MKLTHPLTHFLFAVWLMIGLSACVGMQNPPETAIERLTTVEIAYQEVLKTALIWRREGRLSDADIVRFTNAFNHYEAYRNAARAAIMIGDELQAGQAVSQTSGALTALLQLLAEYE